MTYLTRSEAETMRFASALAGMLDVGDTALNLSTTPSVVLVIGVNGVGRTFRMAKYSAMATKAFSPPESRVMVLTCFPGG